jgi:diamine N-acetyltransferase
MSFALRLATPADVPVIRALATKIWHEHYISIITREQIEYMLDTWYDAALLEQQIVELGHQVWMVTLDGADQPEGYMALSLRDEGQYYLHKFYLDTRGKGIGAEVYRMVLAKYPDLRTLRLNVNRRNFKSVNFYFKMGFRIEDLYDLPVGDRFVMDDFIMVYHHPRV